MNKIKMIPFLLLLSASFTAGFFTHVLVVKISSKEVIVGQQKLPECVLGHCPIYFSMNVDNDNNDSESIVIIPTAMTKGAGKLWVIDKGKVTFESKEYAQIGVEGSPDGDGFILKYATEPHYYNQNKRTRYKYQNGEYRIVSE